MILSVLAGSRLLYFVGQSSNPCDKMETVEELWACGQRASLKTLQVTDLMLIPTISEKSAANIALEMNKIKSLAKSLPENERYQAFSSVTGIGGKKSKLLNSLIDPTEDPTDDPDYPQTNLHPGRLELPVQH